METASAVREAGNHDYRTLSAVLQDAARGIRPTWDGLTELLPPPVGAVAGVFTFTGHNIVAAGVDPEWLARACPPGRLVAPVTGRFLVGLEDRVGASQGPLDIVLAAASCRGQPPLKLNLLQGEQDHPRLRRSASLRTEVRAFEIAGGSGVLSIGKGIEGRWEAGFEVRENARSEGLGRFLALSARHLIPGDDVIFVQVAAGNSASLRCTLAAGFVAIGAEVLFRAGDDGRA